MPKFKEYSEKTWTVKKKHGKKDIFKNYMEKNHFLNYQKDVNNLILHQPFIVSYWCTTISHLGIFDYILFC